MMPIYYENSQGVKIDLLSGNYRLQTADLFDYSWTYTNMARLRHRGSITKFVKEIKEKKLMLSILADTREAYYAAVNIFFETTDYDVVRMSHGRLWVGDHYLQCYIIASEKTEWEYGITSLDNQITVLTDYPFWIREKALNYLPSGQTPSADPFLNYPHNYPYDYSYDGSKTYLNNDHYSDCHFKMDIFGPVINPSVVIAGVPYEVTTEVGEGEYLTIDSRDKTVLRWTDTGECVDEFNNRRRDPGIFTPIPSGASLVSWNDSFGFDITLFQERSEPKWG